MGKRIEEAGNRYGKLVVVEYAGKDKYGRATWVCDCECGGEITAKGGSLRSGSVQSCGCIRAEWLGNTKDELGNTYGKLTVAKFAGLNKWSQALWYCTCACGKESIVPGQSLRSGRTKSCGCGTGESRRLPEGEAAFRYLYRKYQCSAKNRGLTFELNKKTFRLLTQQPCHYCGVSPLQVSAINTNATTAPYYHNGIDRKNSSLGYIKDNVVPCCFVCNRAKSNMGYNSFIAWLEGVASYRGIKTKTS